MILVIINTWSCASNKYNTRYKKLRETALNMSELIHRDEIATSPIRKPKKSRIVFDKSVDLMLV